MFVYLCVYYSEFRSREEYYSVQSQKLQAEVNAHLYSVSQRLPHLSYSPLGRHNEWDKHDSHKPLPDSKESNSSDSLEKSVMGKIRLTPHITESHLKPPSWIYCSTGGPEIYTIYNT